MAKLSVIIPSRDEQFLVPTIDDIFAHAAGEVEVVAVLDSDKWPAGWKEVTERHTNLHTIHNGQSLGMRQSINRGVASAISRGATYIAKSDAHCSFSQGFDEVLKAEMDDDWIVVPRRLRLDPEAWTVAEPDKPPYDYHYLSFPDDPNDFGGPGLNGKPWVERGVQRADILVDEEMSSQGSFWAMKADYFNRLELMDHENYGPFWNEFQEIGLKCWLSGGRVMVNKKCHYLHLHKGKKYGRGYHLKESALTQGRNHTMKWLYNEAWAKQTLPFSWLIEHFAPVPGWVEGWEEKVYAMRRPRDIIASTKEYPVDQLPVMDTSSSSLQIHSAHYGAGVNDGPAINVTDRVRSLVKDDSLDIVVNNSTLTPNQNPFRGKRKTLQVVYSYGDSKPTTITRDEKDWLIIGQARREAESDGLIAETTVDYNLGPARASNAANGVNLLAATESSKYQLPKQAQELSVSDTGMPAVIKSIGDHVSKTASATALNDYLVRKFSLSDRRLRGPMPIELRDFHRNDLAALFAELGFTRGAEIGVAEGHYSEILCKSIPNLEELLLVDPWRRYDGNPWAHSQEHQDFSLNETRRKTAGYNVRIVQDYSMNAVREIPDESLDFVYIDGHHGYDWVMQDLIEWSKRVRSGGIISGDDYYHFKKNWAGVVQAVNSYTDAHRISPWFLIDAPRSVDFFFVKP